MMEEEEALVIIDYKDLMTDPINTTTELSSLLSQAFGSNTNSLGVIAVRNIPFFVETKQAFLPVAHKLAHLPLAYLEKHLTDEASMYNSGWSHGKEKLGDVPDFHKASFYFNPITDTPGTAEDRKLYPVSYPLNKWPDRDVLPELEDLGKKLGTLMRDTVALLAKHVDQYVKLNCTEYDSSMGNEMMSTEKVKGRLLYYYPLDLDNNDDKQDDFKATRKEDEEKGESDDSWIGWHADSGFFTALAGDLFINHETGEPIPRKDVDPNAGLMVMNRTGKTIKVDIPEDCMAVQIGECLQIITGGAVVATPHCVRGVDPKYNTDRLNGSSGVKVARISFPCFVDTVPSFPLKVPSGSSKQNVFDSSVKGCAKIPPLHDR